MLNRRAFATSMLATLFATPRMRAQDPSTWLAKLCRSRCGCTRFHTPCALAAARRRSCTARGEATEALSCRLETGRALVEARNNGLGAEELVTMIREVAAEEDGEPSPSPLPTPAIRDEEQ